MPVFATFTSPPIGQLARRSELSTPLATSPCSCYKAHGWQPRTLPSRPPGLCLASLPFAVPSLLPSNSQLDQLVNIRGLVGLFLLGDPILKARRPRRALQERVQSRGKAHNTKQRERSQSLGHRRSAACVSASRALWAVWYPSFGQRQPHSSALRGATITMEMLRDTLCNADCVKNTLFFLPGKATCPHHNNIG